MYFFQSLEFLWTCFAVVEEGLWELRVGRLLDRDALPIPAEVSRDTRCKLEPNAELPVLEEDVRVFELGHVEGDPLSLLREGALRAPHESRLLEGVDSAVAGRDRNAVFSAQVDGGSRPLGRGHEGLRRVLVRHESRRFKGIHFHHTPPLERKLASPAV